MLQVNLTKLFTKGIKALVSYQNRNYIRDEAKFDDYFTLEFNPAKFKYQLLATEVFQKYVDWFAAYRGDIGDEEFIYLDFEQSRGIDYRNGIYRLLPVFFLETELCTKCFGLSPEEIGKRIAGTVESSIITPTGMVVVASSKVLNLDEAKDIDKQLREVLELR